MNDIEINDEQKKEKKECLRLLENNAKILMTINVSEIESLNDQKAILFRELLSIYAKDMEWNCTVCFGAIYKINVFKDVCLDILYFLVRKTNEKIVEINQGLNFILMRDMCFVIIRQKWLFEVLSRWETFD